MAEEPLRERGERRTVTHGPESQTDPWILPPRPEDVDMLLDTVDRGVWILDAARQRLLAVHGTFSRWLPATELSSVPPLEWIAPASRGTFSDLGSPSNDGVTATIRLIDDEGPQFSVQGRYAVNRKGEGCWIYWFTAVRAATEVEDQLNDAVREQKQRAQSAVRTSLEIYQVTEKIRRAPRLSAILLGVREESELFDRVGAFLLSEAVHARSVRIFTAESDDTLRCVYSSNGRGEIGTAPEVGRTLFEVEKARVRGECDGATRQIPIELRGEGIGLLEIELDPREQAVIDRAPLFRRWLEETIATLGEMVALFLENLRLYLRLETQARSDILTGLHNRRHLRELLDREVARAHRESSELSVIFVDLDHFKDLNDGFGHIVGDQILADFARILESSFRETDDLCRYGGDEFVVVLPVTSPEFARQKAQKMVEEIRGHDFASENSKESITLTLSVGVAGLDAGEVGQDLLRRADEALYVSKRNGRDQITVAPSVRDRESSTL